MGLKQPILDIITKLKAIQGVNFVHIYNNQFQHVEDGNGYAFPFPCVFVEAINPQEYNQLSNGYQQADIDFRIHVGQEQYDAADGNMEQNITIFDLRDAVVSALSLFKPTMCTPLFKVSEEQDYDHTNVYHYIITFRTGFIDDTASTLVTPVLIDPITIELDTFIPHASFDGGYNEDFEDSFLDPDIDKHEIII